MTVADFRCGKLAKRAWWRQYAIKLDAFARAQQPIEVDQSAIALPRTHWSRRDRSAIKIHVPRVPLFADARIAYRFLLHILLRVG